MMSEVFRRVVYVAVAMIVAVSLLAIRDARASSSVPDDLPVVLEVSLLHEAWELVDDASGDIIEVVRAIDTFELEFASWQDWRLTTLCCVDSLDDRLDPSGDAKEQRPDGTVWHRAGFDGEWELLSADRLEGSSPWPTFFPAWDDPVVVPDLGIKTARRLGLDTEALSARSGGGLIRTFYDPLGIPIHAFAIEDGIVSVEMVVTRIRNG